MAGESPRGGERTIAEQAVDLLTEDIVLGRLAPGAKLKIEELKQRYGVGATPLREALSALAAQGFVWFESNRGFRVAPLSKEDICDITVVRCLVEAEALLRAMSIGGDDWESAIVAAFHRLVLTSTRETDQNDSGVGLAAVERAHRDFHTALLSGCGSPRLLDLHRQLYDQALRYRTHAIRHASAFIPTHERIMELVLKRDAAAATQELKQHLQLTPMRLYGEEVKVALASDELTAGFWRVPIRTR